MRSNQAILITIITIVVISVLLFVILMPLSFKVINYDEVGIRYHKVSRDLDDSVETEGRHYVQPGQKFFLFKRRFVTVNFQGSEKVKSKSSDGQVVNSGAIGCLTYDGISVVITASLQYQLILEEIPELFLDFGEEYADVIVTQARASIRNACGQFTADTFYNDRGSIQDRMLNYTQVSLGQVHATAGFLQLINVDLPDRYENAVAAKEAARADVDQALNERVEALIQSATQVLEATEEAKITLSKANAKAGGILSSALNEALGIQYELNITGTVYKNIATTFGFGPEELINYIAVESLAKFPNVLVSVDAPARYSYNSTN